MMSSKNSGFSASDIERYHSGEMSPGERHALEKAALEDPFLADALEGYTFTSTPGNDLAQIKLRLDKKINRKKVVPIFQKYRWLSAASIILVFAAAGWLVYNISGSENKSLTTAQERKQPVDKDSNVNVVSPQQNPGDSKTTTTTQQQPVKNQPTVLEKKVQKTKEGDIVYNSKRKLSKEVAEGNKEETILNLQPSQVQSEIASTNNRMVTSEPGNRKNAISYEPRSNNIPGRIQQQSVLKDFDSTNSLPVRIRGVASNDTVKDLNIVLQPIPMDTAQVLVIGYGTEKKERSKYPQITIDTLEPAEGYVRFDDYVANNLKMPQEFKTKPIAGEVQLSFDVDTNGQPVNITVVKSLCQKCDEEAIRLLKEGPKWKKKKDKKGKITIKF